MKLTVNKGKTCYGEGCRRPATRKGLCGLHYGRLARSGHLTLKGRAIIPVEQRFWQKVEIRGADQCWNWKGYRDSKGYGLLTNGDPKKRRVFAHRLSYRIAHGPFDANLFICHHCDNPPCVNPSHLFLGDIRANNQDKVRKGRQAKGERAHKAVLTAFKVRAIRVFYARGQYDINDIIRLYNISRSTTIALLTGKSWMHV